MSEAKNLLDSQQLGELAVGAKPLNVVQFPGFAREKPPPLTDDEINQIRSIIQAFKAIATTCPIAKKALEGQG